MNARTLIVTVVALAALAIASVGASTSVAAANKLIFCPARMKIAGKAWDITTVDVSCQTARGIVAQLATKKSVKNKWAAKTGDRRPYVFPGTYAGMLCAGVPAGKKPRVISCVTPARVLPPRFFSATDFPRERG